MSSEKSSSYVFLPHQLASHNSSGHHEGTDSTGGYTGIVIAGLQALRKDVIEKKNKSRLDS